MSKIDTEFVPTALEPVPDDYRTDELSDAYADAFELGLWIKEWGAGDAGYLTAVGSYYLLQKLEHDHPDIERELDPEEFTLGDCVEISAPGSGSTRAEAILNGIEKFRELPPLWDDHQRWHEQAASQG